jgi:class 3 adenylate cyclase
VSDAARRERCGHLNAADQRFCSMCGAALGKTCRSCGHANPPEFRFCGRCGSPLDDEVAEVVARPVEERRWATVLFADLSGFTSVSETLDPEEVTALVDRCMQPLGETIERYDGVISNVAGDGLLAVFGVPRAHEDDPERAVRLHWSHPFQTPAQHDQGVRPRVIAPRIAAASVSGGRKSPDEPAESLLSGHGPRRATRDR